MTKLVGLTLHRNSLVSLDGETVGQWTPLLRGPGYAYLCNCGASIKRFGLFELRRKIEIHLAGTQHGRAT